MNIYLREMRINQKNLIIWSVILAALGILVMAFFPTIAKESQTLDKLIVGLPKGLVSAFGLGKISITDILGYYATKQYTTITLFGSIYAIMLSAAMLSKEESDKTIEFLLSKPVTRSEIVTAKLLSVISLIVLFNLLVSITMYITLLVVKTENFDSELFLLLCLGSLLLHLTFASLGFLLSVFVSKSRNILPISLGVVLVTYFIGISASLTPKLDFLKYFSPFKYTDAVEIITTGTIESIYITIIALIIFSTIFLTYILYNKKNFNA